MAPDRSRVRARRSGPARQEAPAPEGGAERVLLVDNRGESLLALATLLEPLGLELITARSGEEALGILLDGEIAAVVVGVQMPGMDGSETAEILRSDGASSSIPILVLAAVGRDPDHGVRDDEVGGFAYICKPFEPEVLRAEVRAVVDRSIARRGAAGLAPLYAESGAALEGVRALHPPGDGDGRRPGLAPVAPRSGARVAARAARWPASGPHAGPAHFSVMTRLAEVAVEASVEAPGAARAAVRRAVGDRLGPTGDVVVLLVSELVTNAVLHALSAATVRLDLGPAVVRVEVQDGESRQPGVVDARATAESGRGLQMVQQLADRYGWTRLRRGKLVWFELDLPEPAAES